MMQTGRWDARAQGEGEVGEGGETSEGETGAVGQAMTARHVEFSERVKGMGVWRRRKEEREWCVCELNTSSEDEGAERRGDEGVKGGGRQAKGGGEVEVSEERVVRDDVVDGEREGGSMEGEALELWCGWGWRGEVEGEDSEGVRGEAVQVTELDGGEVREATEDEIKVLITKERAVGEVKTREVEGREGRGGGGGEGEEVLKGARGKHCVRPGWAMRGEGGEARGDGAKGEEDAIGKERGDVMSEYSWGDG
jgi:hypothetical protein